MRVVYFDCFSGISGDMALAALVDAGADRAYIESELQKIRIEPFALQWRRVNKKGISALKMDVELDSSRPPTHHRHYADIVRMIQSAGFNERVVAYSLAIFEKIGVAEAKIHGIPVEKVHFHEVGAIDSIVDVIGVALALDSLQAERIYSAPVPLGSGTVRCDHGLYPVPAPATLEMMRGLPIAPTDYAMEMTTPTGAGIVSGVVHDFSKGLPPMVVESIGYGAGTRDLPNQPNVLRVVVGSADSYIGQWKANLQPIHADHAHPHEHHHHHGHHDHDHHHHDHDHHHHDHDHHHHDHDHHHHDHDHHHHEHDHHHHDHDHHHHEHRHGHEHEHDRARRHEQRDRHGHAHHSHEHDDKHDTNAHKH
ncbi:nickel pincer cofactor biosynthesis protein LarC [Paenibacillus flagellatus]|uniref:Nickel pincer cofactor biosynthesis protein LarC n=1 Tax=Paenibacillus flagellatus TaxID=2211139 RepID=A0A2V5JZR6_9BACL|nr:nickel pincer cofactor biosynthesis protein LarC [Paenibacillus flagellatus]